MISILSFLTAFIFHCQPISSIELDKATGLQTQIAHCVVGKSEFDVVRTYESGRQVSEYSDQLEYFAMALDYSRNCQMIDSEDIELGEPFTERGLKSVYLCKEKKSDVIIELLSSKKYLYASIWKDRFVYAKYRQKVSEGKE